MVVFEERGNLSVQRREPTNSTHIWRRIWESNPDHIGGRRVLSPLRHPCTPAFKMTKNGVYFILLMSLVAEFDSVFWFMQIKGLKMSLDWHKMS